MNLTVKEFASMGGHARAKKLTPEQRQAISRKGVEARLKNKEKNENEE